MKKQPLKGSQPARAKAQSEDSSQALEAATPRRAATTLARITPQAGQAAGSDWSAGRPRCPHFGQREKR